jgi:hypothetical protein
VDLSGRLVGNQKFKVPHFPSFSLNFLRTTSFLPQEPLFNSRSLPEDPLDVGIAAQQKPLPVHTHGIVARKPHYTENFSARV